MDEPTDVVLDDLPLEEWPDTLLVQYATAGHRKAITELRRRAAAEVDRVLQERTSNK